MIVAGFAQPGQLAAALKALRGAGVPVETYTPAPLEGEPTRSALPRVILAAGLLGAAASFGWQAWSSLWSYPLDVGGRPDFSWQSWVPTVFENAVLVAVVAAFAGFMVANRLPRLYHPVDEADAIRRASSDRWCVAVRSASPDLLARARALLAAADPASVEEIDP